MLLLRRVFSAEDDLCSQRVGDSWALINKLAASAKGRRQLTKTFKLCKPMKSADLLTGWLQEMYFDMAMVNYPYPTSFLSPLPAWPVKAFCKIAQQGEDTLSAIAAASQVMLQCIFVCMSVRLYVVSSVASFPAICQVDLLY